MYALDAVFKQWAESNSKIHIVSVSIGILTLVGSIVMNVLTYTNFSDKSTLFVPIVGSIIIVAGLALVGLRVVKGNSLLVFGIIMLYQSVIGYSLRYSPDEYAESYFPSIQVVLLVISLLLILS